MKRRRIRLAGFTLIEALLTAVIFVILMAAVYGAFGDSYDTYGTQKTYAIMQIDARKALEKMSSELQMSGRIQHPLADQPWYPYIFTNGVATGAYSYHSHPMPVQHVTSGPAFGDSQSIVFKLPEDRDGDGLLTSASTGDIEWGGAEYSYVLVTAPDGINQLERRRNGVRTDVLARYVERINFDTIESDFNVDFNELVITIHMARPNAEGVWLQSTYTTCVTMRNTEEINPWPEDPDEQTVVEDPYGGPIP